MGPVQINGLITPTTGMITLKNALVTRLQPVFAARVSSDGARGMNMLYADDTSIKDDVVTDPAKALWLLREINQEFGYLGTMTLYNRANAPRSRYDELVPETGPYVQLQYIANSQPTMAIEAVDAVDIGIAIHSGLARFQLADIFRDCVVSGGLILMHEQVADNFRGPNQQAVHAAHVLSLTFRKGFSLGETVKSPVFDDETEDSVLLVMDRV